MNRKSQIAIITFILCVINYGFAQKGTLKIGDKAPALEPYEWIKGKPIKSFKKGKPYVIEFGATWCGPCARAIPKLSALSKKYKGKVEIVGVFVQELNNEPPGTPKPKYIDDVREYVKKLGDQLSYTVAVDGPEKTIEKQWIDGMGKSRGVPQTFIIDKQGRIAAHFVGVQMDIIDKLLTAILDDSFDIEAQKENDAAIAANQVVYDYLKPLYIDGNGGNRTDFEFRSILKKSTGKISHNSPSLFLFSFRFLNDPEFMEWLAESVGKTEVEAYREKHLGGLDRVQEVNIPLAYLYNLAYTDTLANSPMERLQATGLYPDTIRFPKYKKAYGKYWPAPVIELSGESPYNLFEKYDYVRKVPKGRGTMKFLQECMRRDLMSYFGFEAYVEVREMPCWFLKARPGAKEKLKTKTPGEKYKTFIKSTSADGKKIYGRSNADMRDVIRMISMVHRKARLNKYNGKDDYFEFIFNNPLPPTINQTGLTNEIDFFFHEKIVEAVVKTGDISVISSTLEPLGLYIEKGTKPMKVVVIRDTKNQ